MSEPGNESLRQRVGKKFRRFMRWTIFIVVVVGLGYLSFMYWGIYSTGVRAGVVIKVSEKGFLFKTYEGQLNTETFGASATGSPIIEVFNFSTTDNGIFDELTQVSLSGERVNLHYTERYMKFFWRGETLHFVTRVERSAK